MMHHRETLTVVVPANVGSNNTLTASLAGRFSRSFLEEAKPTFTQKNHTAVIGGTAMNELIITKGSDGFTAGEKLEVILVHGSTEVLSVASNV